MTIKKLRQKAGLSQEQLAERSGLSLRTIQRAEGNNQLSPASTQILASFFGVDQASLKSPVIQLGHGQTADTDSRMARHRAAQLIIFVVTFFVCVSQWLAYYAYTAPVDNDASLGTILGIMAQIGVAAAILAALFNLAKVTFVWSYYITTSVFVICAIALGIWTEDFAGSPSYQLLFPSLYTLMALCLLLIHMVQIALSLKGETVIITSKRLQH